MEGKIKINREQAAYYGNSLGGILGEVYMASTTAIRKGVLQLFVSDCCNIISVTGVIGVGGGPFGLLLPRSIEFTP